MIKTELKLVQFLAIGWGGKKSVSRLYSEVDKKNKPHSKSRNNCKVMISSQFFCVTDAVGLILRELH